MDFEKWNQKHRTGQSMAFERCNSNWRYGRRFLGEVCGGSTYGGSPWQPSPIQIRRLSTWVAKHEKNWCFDWKTLPFSSLWVSVGYWRAAFPVGSLPIRVLEELPLQFFEVPPAFWGLGVCLRLSGFRKFLSLLCSRTIWLAALGFRAFDSCLQQRTSRDWTYLFLWCFRAVLPTALWNTPPWFHLLRLPKQPVGRTSILYALWPSKASLKPLEAFSFFVRRGCISLCFRFLLFLPAAASSPPLSPAFPLFLCCAACGPPLFSLLFLLVFWPTPVLSSLRGFLPDEPTVSDLLLFLAFHTDDRMGVTFLLPTSSLCARPTPHARLMVGAIWGLEPLGAAGKAFGMPPGLLVRSSGSIATPRTVLHRFTHPKLWLGR